MMRTIRAFTKALQMTLRGETVPPHPHARLHDWIAEGERRASIVIRVADKAGFDVAKRKAVTLKIDGRTTNANTLLEAVAFHLREEYPYLLKNFTEHSITAIYASNANDQYAIARLSEHDAPVEPAVTRALADLRAHLDAIPPGSELD